MTPREVLLSAIRFDNPPYTPWAIEYTAVPAQALAKHFKGQDVSARLHDHMVTFRAPTREGFKEIGPGRFQDPYGTIWDRSIDPDIGTPIHYPLPGPSLKGFKFPKCKGSEEAVRAKLAKYPERAVRMSHGFTLFERAWALRGMEHLLMDFVERPAFAHELLDAIVEHDMEVLQWGGQFKPDIIHFGDDWGQQQGLIMGPRIWREFLKPRLARLYARAHELGAVVSIHCCGDVDELFDDLVEIGVNLFNPFQPEVMDIVALKKQYHGRLAFHGGMSIQRVLPFGTPEDVRKETRRLIREIGRGGGYVFAPAHQIPADVPVKNILAMVEVLTAQKGW